MPGSRNDHVDATDGLGPATGLPGPRRRGPTPARAEGVKLNQSVRKAITLLRATAEDRSANVSSLARVAGLPRATALRMIQTLEQEGFLLRVPGDDRVLLGPELLRVARSADDQLLLREVSRPTISDLVAAVRETVTLSVLAPDGGLDLVDQVDAPHHLRPGFWVGERFPLHASASGKVLLSTYDDERLEHFLREPLARFTARTVTTAAALRSEVQGVRRQRYACTVDEEEVGLSAVAAGIHGPANELLGVLSVSGPTQRLDLHAGGRVVEHLRAAVDRIETALRRGSEPPPLLEVVTPTPG
jgi:DNA-binding IclR family transcriptional regulator